MADIKAQVDNAKKLGYSDDDIITHLSKSGGYSDKINSAITAGYSSSEIINHLSGSPRKTPQATEITPSEEKVPSPTEGNTFAENALIGAGKSFVDTYQGLKQLGAAAGGKLGLVDEKTIRDLQAQETERARLDQPLMQTGGGVIGNIGGQIAQAVVPGAALGKIARLARVTNPIVKAGLGGATYAATQPVTDERSRLENIAFGGAGGAVGQGVVSGLAKLGAPAAAALSPGIRKLAEKAKNLGIDLHADQLTDSKFVKTLSSVLNRLPFTGAQASHEAQQKQYNRAIGRTFGEDVDKIPTDVYNSAKQRIGGGFKEMAEVNNLRVRNELIDNLFGTYDEALKFSAPESQNAVKSAIDELFSKADKDGIIPGRAYQSFDSKLSRLTKGGGETAYYLGAIKEHVRNAMDDSILPKYKKEWDLYRRQYANLKGIRDLVAKDGSSGDINPALLTGRLGSSEAGKESMAMGTRGDLGDLAMIGRQFLREKVQDPGAAKRALIMSLLGGAGGAAAYADPTSAAGAALLAATGGRGLNALMKSRGAANYMLEGSKALRRLSSVLQPLPYATVPSSMVIADRFNQN